MSLPVASAPVAVLVLAWDETTPAVRALVEATEIAMPLVDSIMVLVPAGPSDAEEISQEEFLPLDELPELLALTPALAPPPALPAELPAADAPVPAAPQPPAAASPARPAAPVAPKPAPIVAGAATQASLLVVAARPAVRVLRLSSFSLPELAAQAAQALPLPIWRGSLAAPTAPYIGSSVVGDTAPAATASASKTGSEAASASTTASDATMVSKQLAKLQLFAGKASSPSLTPPATTSDGEALPLPSAAAPTLPGYSPAEAAALASDAEPDLPSLQLADDIDLPAAAAAEEPLATEFAAAQAGWPAALASLREPAAQEEQALLLGPDTEATYYTDVEAGPAAADEEVPSLDGPPALWPVRARFDAPNLNFQVIQYARFAVPVALAEAPFAAIYAPAWPTWLAAQELRQRTGQPLVLHVATLAAANGESVEAATGWQAELQRQALHRADLILTETPALAYRLRHELNLPAHLVRPVPAADTAAIAQALHTARPRPMVSLG